MTRRITAAALSAVTVLGRAAAGSSASANSRHVTNMDDNERQRERTNVNRKNLPVDDHKT